jgi:hypothetical protein
MRYGKPHLQWPRKNFLQNKCNVHIQEPQTNTLEDVEMINSEKSWKTHPLLSILYFQYSKVILFCCTYLINAMMVCTTELVWWAHYGIPSQTAHICALI